jgi:hypothetical protein
VNTVLVPVDRLRRWVQNFETRHGATVFRTESGGLAGLAADGSTFLAEAPFGRTLDEPTVAALMTACDPPEDWGVLLVRKGGFAIARLAGEQVLDSKVGQRHVQGRTKAGGQSQQRFARRRDNQARAAYEAAADHAARLVADAALLVVGGDRGAVTVVLEDPRLRGVRGRTQGMFLPVPDPRRSVLDAGIAEACAVQMCVTNA